MSTNSNDRPAVTLGSARPTAEAPPTRPVVNVRDLLGAAREVILVHQGEHYRLRVTAKDKLILTK
jgi:hemin uptake protein HemP